MGSLNWAYVEPVGPGIIVEDIGKIIALSVNNPRALELIGPGLHRAFGLCRSGLGPFQLYSGAAFSCNLSPI